jgi:hypothetical protein
VDEQLQSGKWLISDANFPFAAAVEAATAAVATEAAAATTTTTTTATANNCDAEGEHQHRQHKRQPDSWPYIEIKASNLMKLNNLDSDQPLDGLAIGSYSFEAAHLSELSPSKDCYDNQNGASNHRNLHNHHHHHQHHNQEHLCSCNGLPPPLNLTDCELKEPDLDEHTATIDRLAQSLIGSFEGDVCYSVSHPHRQQYADDFIELFPDAENQFELTTRRQPHSIIAYEHGHQPNNYERPEDRHRPSLRTPPGNNTALMPAIHQTAHDKQYNHVVVNQSLNSSSIGSPSTNNQYGSSPLGSLTNTTPSNTESYQLNSSSNNNSTVTLQRDSEHHHHLDGAGCPLSKRDSQFADLAPNKTGSGSYRLGSPSTVVESTRAANQRPATKSRLASILKNCNHSTNEGAPPTTTTTAMNSASNNE